MRTTLYSVGKLLMLLRLIFVIVARKNDVTTINLNVHEEYLLCKCLLNKDAINPKEWRVGLLKAYVLYK